MGARTSRITSFTIVYSTVYSVADQRKHQRSASLAFVRRIHRWPVNSPHKWPITRKRFPFDDVVTSSEYFIEHKQLKFKTYLLASFWLFWKRRFSRYLLSLLKSDLQAGNVDRRCLICNNTTLPTSDSSEIDSQCVLFRSVWLFHRWPIYVAVVRDYCAAVYSSPWYHRI